MMLRRLLMASGAPTSDPFWANVTALLHFDGADGSTTFADQKGNIWTPSGDAQIDTAQWRFGGASGLFDGSGDYISTPNNAGFDFGSGDFTVEFWMRPAANVTSTQVLFCKAVDARARSFACAVVSDNRMYMAISANGTNFTDYVSDVGVFASGVFSHVAYVRFGSVVSIYVNGVSVVSQAISGAIFTANCPAQIGGRPSDGQYFNGHIDDLRVTKGVARYTANFSPPTAAFPNG